MAYAWRTHCARRTLDTGLVFDERFLWRTLGCVLTYSADVIGPGRIAQSNQNTSVFFSQIFGPSRPLGTWLVVRPCHVGTWLQDVADDMYVYSITEHTYPIISLSSHIDLFWSPGIYLDGQVQWSTTWSRRWRWRFNELPSWKTGIDFGLM